MGTVRNGGPCLYPTLRSSGGLHFSAAWGLGQLSQLEARGSWGAGMWAKAQKKVGICPYMYGESRENSSVMSCMYMFFFSVLYASMMFYSPTAEALGSSAIVKVSEQTGAAPKPIPPRFPSKGSQVKVPK